MRVIAFTICLLAAGFSFGTLGVRADIFVWEDAGGTTHVSNLNPPPGATVLLRMRETPPAGPSESLPPAASPSEGERAAARQREERLKHQASELERRLEAAEEKMADMTRSLDRLDARAPRYSYERYAGAVITADRYRRPRHDRDKDRGPFREANRRREGAASLEGSPFPLGKIDLPLFNARDHFRRPSPPSGGARHDGRDRDRQSRGRDDRWR